MSPERIKELKELCSSPRYQFQRRLRGRKLTNRIWIEQDEQFDYVGSAHAEWIEFFVESPKLILELIEAHEHLTKRLIDETQRRRQLEREKPRY